MQTDSEKQFWKPVTIFKAHNDYFLKNWAFYISCDAFFRSNNDTSDNTTPKTYTFVDTSSQSQGQGIHNLTFVFRGF